MPFAFRRSRFVAAAVTLAACGRDSVNPAGPVEHAPAIPSAASLVVQPTITVSSTPELYAKVNDVANRGARLVLMPHTYTLDPTQPNGGRLELQQDMSLQGVVGNAQAVIIDASRLPATSYAIQDGATGAVRVGRGANSLEWITVSGAANGAANIETDLISSVPSRVTISHVIASGSPRGIDVRNLGASSAGRVLVVSISNTESFGNVTGNGQGLRAVNTNGATGAVIRLTLQANNFHGNRIGALFANNNTSYGTVSVTSTADHFDRNGIGLGLAAGVSSGTMALYNVVSFSAQQSTFQNNVATPPPGVPVAGVTVEGGSSTVAGFTSFNTVSADLSAVQFGNNQNADLRAWGARSTVSLPSGTNNVASVTLRNVASVLIAPPIASEPAEPAGTNVVSVVR